MILAQAFFPEGHPHFEVFNDAKPHYESSPMPRTRRAVFLDRDGTLIEEGEYLHRPEDVRIFPGTGAALRQLSEAGFALFIVSNQSGVGRGYFTMADVENVHRHLCAELEREGVKFTKIYVAPEAPDQPSRGRKPSPGADRMA